MTHTDVWPGCDDEGVSFWEQDYIEQHGLCSDCDHRLNDSRVWMYRGAVATSMVANFILVWFAF